MGIGDTTMVQNGEWHEAQTQNSPPPGPASVPSVEGIAGTVLRQMEETQGMAKDERGMGDWNHSHWQVSNVVRTEYWRYIYLAIISEAFVESVPQVHILIGIWAISRGGGCESPVQKDGHLFIVTFTLSVLSATFGVAKFIKSGPARMINNEKCLMGFCSAAFILLFFNIAATLVGRGVVLGFCVDQFRYHYENKILVILYFIPQLLHVS